MNNKGFAITTILYGTLILFLMLLVSMLGILSSHKDRLEKLIESNNGARDIINGIGSDGIAYAVYSADDKSLSFYKTNYNITVGSEYNGKTVTAVYTGIETDSYNNDSSVPWYNYRGNVKSVSVVDEIMPVSTSYWFNGFIDCTSFSLNNLNTSMVTDMSHMFYSAGVNDSAFEFYLDKWDTSKVTNMSYMFYNSGYNSSSWGVYGLKEWDVSKVTNMSHMFEYAGYKSGNYFSLDLTGWNTSSVTDMSYMFAYAGISTSSWSLRGVGGFNTSKVTNMSSMFKNTGCKASLFELDLSSWNTSKVTDMSAMFAGSGSAATTWEVNLTSWNTSKVTDMSAMFYNAGYSSTTFVLQGLPGWDVSRLTDADEMFYNAGYSADWFVDLRGWSIYSNVPSHVNFNKNVEAKVVPPGSWY